MTQSADEPRIQTVLFVCLGNICRSPTAEEIFRQKAKSAGLDLTVDSAGTGGWHIGEPPYPPMQEAALARGYDISRIRGRQFSRADFSRYQLIFVMDQSNLDHVLNMRPHDVDTPVELLLNYAPDQPLREVPDPYHTRDFDQAIDLIEAACDGLIYAKSEPE